MRARQRYEDSIEERRIETFERERKFNEERLEHERIKSDFSRYCKKISKFRAAKLLNRVYKARVNAGLPPFTHAYDYALRGNCWLAKKDFRIGGRYGSDSGDFVFVPEGIAVTGGDHTTVIHFDDWNRNSFVPAYSNTT